MRSIHTPEHRVFVECLTNLRRENEVTQVQLAEAIDEDQSFISKYERGQRRLDLIQVRSICHELGVSLQDFVSRFEQELTRRGID
jgi:transcriptional regulator with XRE-family HTH domain